MKKTTPFKKTRIMVFGTFDGVHLGHLNFFKQARDLAKNPFLIVSIARDKNVEKIKGKKPNFSERKRLNLVKKARISDKVILAAKDEYFKHILKEKPNIIALGYDQRAYVKELKRDLKKLSRGQMGKEISMKIIRLKPYKVHIYKNHLLKK